MVLMRRPNTWARLNMKSYIALLLVEFLIGFSLFTTILSFSLIDDDSVSTNIVLWFINKKGFTFSFNIWKGTSKRKWRGFPSVIGKNVWNHLLPKWLPIDNITFQPRYIPSYRVEQYFTWFLEKLINAGNLCNLWLDDKSIYYSQNFEHNFDI